MAGSLWLIFGLATFFIINEVIDRYNFHLSKPKVAPLKKDFKNTVSVGIRILYPFIFFTIIMIFVWYYSFPQGRFAELLNTQGFGNLIPLFVTSFLFLLFSVIIIEAIHKKMTFNASSDIIVSAKVISKTFEIKHFNDGEGGRTSSKQHFIAFELFGGKRKNFTVDVERYNTILENEEGILTYRENEFEKYIWFIDFQRQV